MFDEIQKDYLIQLLVFFTLAELKKNKSLLELIEITHLFKERTEVGFYIFFHSIFARKHNITV